jgi:hypothetical protein
MATKKLAKRFLVSMGGEKFFGPDHSRLKVHMRRRPFTVKAWCGKSGLKCEAHVQQIRSVSRDKSTRRANQF